MPFGILLPSLIEYLPEMSKKDTGERKETVGAVYDRAQFSGMAIVQMCAVIVRAYRGTAFQTAVFRADSISASRAAGLSAGAYR